MGGSLELHEILNIFNMLPEEYKKNIKTFVETGTYKGDTVSRLSPYFDTLHTFEIHEGLYNSSKNRLLSEGKKNVQCYLGDSVQLLKTTMKFIDDESCIFFIDAHISGSDSSFCNKYQVPLIEELEVICSQLKSKYNIFILDDARFWYSSLAPPDWKHITEEGILNIFKSNNFKIIKNYLENDRYIVVVEK